MKKTHWIMDYETIVNCFVAVFEPINSDDYKVFVVHPTRNDMSDFLQFLKDNITTKDWHLGFNNLSFDAQITEFILTNEKAFSVADADTITAAIYRYAQSVINRPRTERPDYPEYKLRIPVVDIFKLNNWDNNAKRASLKWIQTSLNWNNVQEMPYPHYEPVKNEEELSDMIGYCINDVRSTKAIFNFTNSKGKKEMHEQINLRAELSNTYELMLHSASEPRISKEMFLHFLSEKLGQDKRMLRNLRSSRDEVCIKNIMLPYIQYETPEFKAMFEWFKTLNVKIDEAELLREDKSGKKVKGPEYRMHFSGVETAYALGGLHGCIKPGVYASGNGRIIVSADVTSFYPNLAIRNNWSPAHIPQKDFCELYEWFFEERKKHKKGSSLNYLFKIILNATYGLSKNIYSFLYDPEFTYKITINGQLTLSMLYEMIATRIPNAQPLMQNTDGLEFIINQEHYNLFLEICKEWEKMTNLELEMVNYDKMIIRDVNNYIAVHDTGEVKFKGCFEYDGMALHKNHSALIVSKAWEAYFLKGIKPEDFIKANRDVRDYCIMEKLKSDWYFVEKKVEKGVYTETPLQRLVRFFITKTGSKIVKCNKNDKRQMQLVSGQWMQTLFNDYKEKPWEEYNINDAYYLDCINREIQKIEAGCEDSSLFNEQLKLF